MRYFSSKTSAPFRKNKASVVVIGGGVVGTSIAYHLAKGGLQDVVLLERTELTAGSTWHAAGLTTYFNPGINLKRFHQYSMTLYKALEDETGQAVGLHTPGSIRIATTPERFKEAKYQMSRAGWNTTGQYLVGPKEIKELHPLVETADVLGGIYNPGDGHIDPYSLTHALAIGAKKYGAEIYLPVLVTGLKYQEKDKKWEVETEKNGSIIADHVVNAAGLWAKEVGKLAGVELPLASIHHQYVVTGPIAEVEALKTEPPVLRDLEGSYYLRKEGKGILIGPYEQQNKMVVCDEWARNGMPYTFAQELFEPDLDRISWNFQKAIERVPVTEKGGVKRIVNGPISYTPDVLPIIGPVYGKRNFWVAAGNSYGIIHAGGEGKYIADWIINGEPSFELLETDPARYGVWTTPAYTMAKVRESYGFNNLLGYPHEERPGGRPARTSPLYFQLKQRGAEFGFSNGWERPLWFALEGDQAGYKASYEFGNWLEPMKRECKAIMERVGLMDLTSFSKYIVSGPDATSFLDKLVANTLPPVGKIKIVHFLTPKGKVLSEMTLSRISENTYYLISGATSELHDLRWLEQHVTDGLQVKVENVTTKFGVLGIAGPKSADVLQKAVDQNANPYNTSLQNFPFFTHKQINIGSVDVLALRLSFTGELGWELHVPLEQMPVVYETLLAHGKEFEIADVGAFAVNSLRLEKGFRVWGYEMNKDTGPFEAGLGPFVRLEKPNFIGKEALLAQKSSEAAGGGAMKKLVCLTFDSKGLDSVGNESVWIGDQVVGNTTSGGYGCSVNKTVAYAYLPRQYAEVGTEVSVDLIGQKISARVTKEPLVPAYNIRNKGTKAK